MSFNSLGYVCIICWATSLWAVKAPLMGADSGKGGARVFLGIGPMGSHTRPRGQYVPTSTLLLGVVHNGTALAVEKYLGKNASYYPPIVLYQGLIRAAPGKPERCRRYEYAQKTLTCSLYRWRIAQGCFWGSGSLPGFGEASLRRMPLEELPFFRQRQQGTRTPVSRPIPKDSL